MHSSGKLILTAPGNPKQEYNLGAQKITLGRAPNNDIIIQDPKASRTHAQIEYDDDKWKLADLKSTNGTLVNGERIDMATLAPGDVITVGSSSLRLEVGLPEDETIFDFIQSESDLETTLSESSLSMTLSDTSTARVVISMADRTWEVPIQKSAIVIGRHPENDLTLDDPKVSRQHARIERRGDSYILRDLESRNGTWLREGRVDEHTLRSGDMFRIGDAQLVFKEGFQHEELTLHELPKSTKKPKRRPVVIVPGIMGSELWLDGEKIWPNVRYLFTRPENYKLPELRPLEVGGIIQEVVIVPNLIKMDQYNLLGDYLEEGINYERGKDLFEFAYDWRQDVRASARRLAQAIESWSIKSPITIIAHSLGTLVSRYYVEKYGGKDKVGQIILLGGPHSGTPQAIISLVVGEDLLPFGLLVDRLRDVLATFPSVYQILPVYPCVYSQAGHPVDIYKDDSWLPEWQRPLFQQGYEFRRELGTQSSVPTVSVFGYGLDTVTKIVVQQTSEGKWQKMDFQIDPKGDSRIPEGSAVLEGSDLHPVQQYHGKLFVDNDVKMRLKMELTR